MNEQPHLPDGDGLALVAERDPTELRVVGESLYADRFGGLDESDNFLASLRELWRLT